MQAEIATRPKVATGRKGTATNMKRIVPALALLG